MPSACTPSAPVSSLETNTKPIYESRCDIPSTVETMTHSILLNETHPKQVITSEPHPIQNSENETDPKLITINETYPESSSFHSTTADTVDVGGPPWNTVVKKSPKKRSADIQLKSKQVIIPDSVMKIRAASASPPGRNQKQHVKKAVFNIDNLDCAVTTEDMQNYLHDINIKTVSIHTCKSWVTDKGVTAMRVCIEEKDADLFIDATNWATGVIIRKWKSKKITPSETTGNLAQAAGSHLSKQRTRNGIQ